MFADVTFPQRRYQVFTYRIPPRLIDHIQVGSRVLVPLGTSSARGLVCEVLEDFPVYSGNKNMTPKTIREISAIVDFASQSELTPSLIKLANQVGEYYLAPPGAALRLILPPLPSNRVAKRIVLTDEGRQALNHVRLSDDQKKILTRLTRTTKGLTLPTLLKSLDGNTSAITGLKRRKFVQEIEWVRDASESIQLAPSDSVVVKKDALRRRIGKRHTPQRELLSDREFDWLSRVDTALFSRAHEEFLVHVSTIASRRILFELIDKTRHYQRRILILCPEIQQISRMVASLRKAGHEHVGVYHGDLSALDRLRTWQGFQQGQFEVMVGTRLALFVPIPSLGLIWLDQEEASSFQEERSPQFHARNVARMRGQLESATLVLHSPHPSLETVCRLGHEKELSLIERKSSLESQQIQLVNQRQFPYGTILSDLMRDGIRATLIDNGQAILFLNRKGYASSLMCRDCGYRPQCSKCGVSLTVHKRPVCMRCSYCGQQHIAPVVCPSCQSVKFETAGYGTEQLEAVVMEEFPDAVIARYDREVVRTASQEKEIVRKYKDKEIDILIGTEFLFHAIDLPQVQFVGIPHADGGLHFPDFRAAERTYHRLMEAIQFMDESSASRAVVQTWLPTHHVLQAIVQQDPTIFYQEELQIRQALNYPPYSRLIQIAISGKHQDAVNGMVQRCRERVLGGEESNVPSECILGPLFSSRRKSPGLTCAVLIVKDFGQIRLHERIQRLQKDLAQTLREQSLRMEIYVDPDDLH